MNTQSLTDSTTLAFVESEENGKAADTIKSTNKAEAIRCKLQPFVNARKRPALFFSTGIDPQTGEEVPISWGDAMQIRSKLEDKQFEDLDFVIDSGGGDIASAYSIIRLLRSHTTGKLSACVPTSAKSAATLLCLGADVIILDEQAHLGPLDTQLRVAEKLDFKSALNPFKSLEALTTHARGTAFDLTQQLIRWMPDLSVSNSFQLATEFVEAVNGTLLTKLDADKLGEFGLKLSEGEAYGMRVLTELAHCPEKEANKVIKKLVYGYPSHGYVIDYYELQNLGLPAEPFKKEEERIAVRDLTLFLWSERFKIETKTIIELVEPSDILKEDGSEAATLVSVS